MWSETRSHADEMIGWDVFDAVLTPGDLILLMSWRTKAYAKVFENTVILPEHARLRHVRVVRDYGMFDRRGAPQYYPDIACDPQRARTAPQDT
jgi:hypothetical protein